MSSICGLWRTDGAPSHHRITAMLDALDHWNADARGEWTENDVALGHLLLSTSRASAQERQPLHDDAAQLTITGDLRLDNRDDLCALLGISQGCTHADGRLILLAYQKYGEDCVAHFKGDFAFAIWDGTRRRMFCARDRFGVKPFYYHHSTAGFAFGSEMKGLLTLDFIDREINDAWVGDFLHRIMLEGETTFYSGIRRLEPAHALIVTETGCRARPYWSPDTDAELQYRRDEDYFEGFRERLVAAVDRRLRSDGDVGAELSGGLDSSALCAIAHRLLSVNGRALHTFSQVRPEASSDPDLPADSRAAIDLLIEQAGIVHASFLTGDDTGIVRTLDWSARFVDEPPRVVVGLFNDLLYEAVHARGLRVLLSGYGGNQGVSGAASTLRSELLRSMQWRALWQVVSTGEPVHRALRSVAGVISREFAPRTVGERKLWKKFPYRPLRDDVGERIRIRERAESYQQLYTRPGTLREQTAFSLTTPNVALRLEWGNLCATTRRIEYRYPLLDQDLIEFYLAIPGRLKYTRGFGRYVFRNSISGFVPEEIQWARGSRTSANPGAVARKRRDREELLARITSLDKNNPVFDYVDLDKLLARPDLPGPNGRGWDRDTELLGVLVLEQKLRQARARA